MAHGTVTIDGVEYKGDLQSTEMLLHVALELVDKEEHGTLVMSGPGSNGQVTKRVVLVSPTSKISAAFEYETVDPSAKRIHELRDNVGDFYEKLVLDRA
jgi:hypothetical protein